MAEELAEMVDLQFSLRGEAIPKDHADALWAVVRAALPWLAEEEHAAIHPLSGLSPAGDSCFLSRRTRLVLRLPGSRVAEATAALTGVSFQLGGYPMTIGAATMKDLMLASALYSKFVAVTPASAGNDAVSEDAFLAACQMQLAAFGIRSRLVCGRAQSTQTPAGRLSGFSLMLADLDGEASLTLQHRGLGTERKRGCGIFVPHKSMKIAELLD